MKRFILVSAALLALTACEQQNQASAPEQKQVAEIAPEAQEVDHYYSMKDGFEYGYEPAISKDAENSGQAAAPLLMFKYTGEKDGIYQAFTKEGTGAITALQCNNPCEFIKIIAFFNGVHIKTERLKATESTIGWVVMADAINGKLEQYIAEKNGKKFTVWFDEQHGMKVTPIEN